MLKQTFMKNYPIANNTLKLCPSTLQIRIQHILCRQRYEKKSPVLSTSEFHTGV